MQGSLRSSLVSLVRFVAECGFASMPMPKEAQQVQHQIHAITYIVLGTACCIALAFLTRVSFGNYLGT